MRQKHISLLTVYTAGLLCVSCTISASPKKILTECLEAVVRADFEVVYAYFSFKDQSVKSLNEFLKDQEMTDEEIEIARLCGHTMSYEIGKFNQMDDSAVASVSVTVPDVVANRLSFLFFEVKRIHVIDTLTGPHNRTIFISQIHGIIRLIRENTKWSMDGNWEFKRIKEAEEALARSAYIKDSVSVTTIKVFGKEQDRDAYLTAVVVNKGHRHLSKIELLISCLDRQAKPIYSLISTPVSERTVPLGPKSKKKFKEKLTGIPANWASIVQIKVMNCRFFD